MAGHFNGGVFPGAKFNMLTIVERMPRQMRECGQYVYKVRCKCDCGNEIVTVISSVVNGATKSCGCLNRSKRTKQGRERAAFANKLLVPGERFGRLSVIKRIEIDGKLTETVECICDCGNKTRSEIDSLMKGRTQSCGCFQREQLIQRNKDLGKYQGFSHAEPETYKVWAGMIRRCHSPNGTGYNHYGAKGVKVCQYLREDPRNLVSIVGLRPAREYSMDRYPKFNGHYSCGQCAECKANGWELNIRWADPMQQGSNKSNNVWLDAFGKTMTLSQWIRASGLSDSTIKNRLDRGWSIERAITTPNKLGVCYNPNDP